MFGIGYQEMVLIGVAALLIFGPGRLPEVASQVGKWVREFRRMSADLTSEFEDAMSEVEDVKRSVQREFGSMSKEVAGVSKSVKKDLSGVKPGNKASGAKAPGTKTGTARAIGAKSTGTAAKPTAARPTNAMKAATGKKLVDIKDLPVATKADPLADVSFLDDDIPVTKNGHAGAKKAGANGATEVIVEADVDPAVARMRQRRAAAGYGRRS
jgi:Tat protein translocase TatB subunit